MKELLAESIPTNKIHLNTLVTGFIVSCLLQPIVLNENTEDADFGAIIMDDERAINFKRAMFASTRIRENLRKLIPYYDSLGVFE